MRPLDPRIASFWPVYDVSLLEGFLERAAKHKHATKADADRLQLIRGIRKFLEELADDKLD